MSRLYFLVVILVGFALGAAPAQAACDKPVSPGELARMLSTADAAFGNMDADSFRRALSLVRSSIPCLSGPLAESQAAAYHRAAAYEAFLDRDHAAAVQQFRAVLAASPGYRLSEQVAPAGHPLRIDFEIAQGLPAEPSHPLPPPVAGSLRVDGRASTQAPVALPFLVQQVDDEGKVLTSAMVKQGSISMPYAAKEEPARTLSIGGRHRVRVPLVAAAVVAGVTSAGLYGFSSARASDFWDPATPDDELQQLRRQTNTTGYASLGAGIVAIGAGTAAVLTFVW